MNQDGDNEDAAAASDAQQLSFLSAHNSQLPFTPFPSKTSRKTLIQ